MPVQEYAPSGSRRAELVLWGALAGMASGLLVGVLMAYQGMLAGRSLGAFPAWGLFGGYGTLSGAALGLIVGRRPHGLAMATSSGLTIGLLGWLAWFLTLDPILRGQAPTWSVEAAGGSYRELVGVMLHGALAGVLFHGLTALGTRTHRAKPPPPAAHVVILGGGFAGVSAARRFERLTLRDHQRGHQWGLRRDRQEGRRYEVTLVSGSNFLLFTPMLAEVASGALEARHISTPVRAAASHTRFCHGVAEEIDTRRRTVRVATGSGKTDVLSYDHLVLAVGSVPHFFDLPGIAEHAFSLKTLDDATRLRGHVLELLERADLEPDPGERRRQLTFVVAGGGFAGTETIAELFDLVHGVLHYYPGIDSGDPRFVLVHSGERILPELSAELGEYARERLEARGITFRLGVRAAGATAQDVELTDGERIPTRTFVWTAGNRPGPLVAGLPVPGERGRGGALVVDSAFRVAGLEGVWAIGDCAQIPDLDSGGAPHPPTAQHALREGKVVADNIAAALRGRQPRAFRFRTIGVFVALGHRTAAGEIRGRRFSGLAAWLLWRGIYLVKLPGIEKRVRVFLDWTLDLAFPRDIAVTTPPHSSGRVPDRRPTRSGAAEAS